MKKYILTFDIGTQSLRAMLISNRGEIAAIEQEKYNVPYFSKKKGYAEQDPEVYWNALVRTSKALSEKNPQLFENILGVTVTTMRDSCVCIDKDGNVVRDCILWMDTRRADASQIKMPLKSKLAFWLVGMTPTILASYEITRSNWMQQNEKELWDKTSCFMLLSGYINFKLTGRAVDSYAGQIGHIPLDYKNKMWKTDDDLQQCVFNIPREKLCELVEPGSIIGKVSAKLSQLIGVPQGKPIIASGADKACETLGCGVLANRIAAISYGTSATIEFSTKEYVEAERFLPSYPAVALGYYNPEVQIYRGFWLLRWFIDNFAQDVKIQAVCQGVNPEAILNKQLSSVPIGCDGLVLQPYWAPLLKKPDAKGTIVGLRDIHTRIHLYRAIIEGIAYALYDAMLTMEKRQNLNIEKLVVSGGGSVSDEICQITADIFGLPVYRLQTHQASGLGSAICAFTAVGEFGTINEAIGSMVHYNKPIMPKKENTDIYHKVYNQTYKKIHKSFKRIYHKQYRDRNFFTNIDCQEK